jgi:hypothetical protein
MRHVTMLLCLVLSGCAAHARIHTSIIEPCHVPVPVPPGCYFDKGTQEVRCDKTTYHYFCKTGPGQ